MAEGTKLAEWDRWLGEAFCLVMLPDLRSIITAYLPWVPLWGKSNSDCMRINKGGTCVECIRDVPGYDVALSQTSVGELFQPKWRVLLQRIDDSRWTRLDALMGVAKIRTWNQMPDLDFYGISLTGRRWNNGFLTDYLDYGDDVTGLPYVVIDVQCDLSSQSMHFTVNGKLWLIATCQAISDLESFSPYIQLYSNTSATISTPLRPDLLGPVFVQRVVVK